MHDAMAETLQEQLSNLPIGGDVIDHQDVQAEIMPLQTAQRRWRLAERRRCAALHLA